MKQSSLLKIIVPLLAGLLLLSACELPRPGGEGGDISALTPEIPATGEQPATAESPTTEPPTAAPPTAAPPTTEPGITESPTPLVPDQPTAAPPDESAPPAPGAIDPQGVPAAPPPPPDSAEPNKVLVKLTLQAAIQARSVELVQDDLSSAGLTSLEQQLQQLGGGELTPVVEEVAESTGQNMDNVTAQSAQVGQLYAVTYTANLPPQAAAAQLSQDPAIEFAEPNFIAGIAGQPATAPVEFDPNDPFYPFQWHFQNIGLSAAWDLSTGQDVIVAVIDTGIDFGTPDLAVTNRLPGYDFANSDNDPTDDQGHGTHVAGTVAQSTNNNLGAAGVAFNARLMPVKVLGSDGNGSYENIIKGIMYAVDQGADVINMSLAGGSPSAALRDTVQYATDRGVVVIAAAGNSGSAVAYPAAYDEFVIGVGAVRFDNTKTDYSNFGSQIDLVAPGGDINVDQNGDGYADGVLQQTRKADGSYGYLFYEGTSMASPHVAGLAALLLARNPGASPAAIEAVMAQTALQGLGDPDQYGAGLIQADAAVAAISPTPDTPTPDTPTTTPVTPQPATDTPTPIPPTPSPTFTLTPTPSPTVTPTPVTPAPPTDTPTPTLTPSPTPTLTPSSTPTFTPTPTPSPSPTVSPTPTSPPLPAGELLQNGDFEADGGWIFGDTPLRGSYSSEQSLSGNRSVKLGITTGHDRYSFTSVWQKVTIPAEASHVTLTANIYPVSKDRPNRDVQNVLILNESFRAVKTLSRGLSNSQSWESVSYDLTDLRGQTIYVYFGVYNNGYLNRPSALFIDDVSLQWAR